MQRLLHRARRVPRARPTVAALWRLSTRRLARARLHYGHGTDQARDDAAALIAHVLRLTPQQWDRAQQRRVPAAAQTRLEALLLRRIRERVPVVYLTQRCWFAGLPMYVDERVLIPRSPIAELIEQRFAPWLAATRVRRILDLGTGSGCIAIACARAFPGAHVDAVDLSRAALEVARLNIRRHRLQRRVHARLSDHFRALRAARYDIIVSNPPYVGERELQGLPREYRHEPRLALAAGRDGLDSVKIILRDAAAHLNPRGLLIVEVGDAQAALEAAYPRLPFAWPGFRRGGGGVFVLTREQLGS